MKTFPKSWPYLNNKGFEIDIEVINKIVINIFKRFNKKSLDFGLELAYIILWALDQAESKEHLEKLVSVVMVRAIKKGMSYEKRRVSIEIPLVEHLVHQEAADILDLLTLENLLDPEYTIEEILEQDRRVRHRTISKIRRKL